MLLLFHGDVDIVVVVVVVVVDVVVVVVLFLHLLLAFSRLRTLTPLPARKADPCDIKQHFFHPLQVAAPAHFQ